MSLISKALLSSFLLMFLIMSCQTASKPTNAVPSAKREATKGLDAAHAAHRAQHISNIQYNLDIDLLDSRPNQQLDQPEKFTHYNGKLTAEFDLDKAVPLTLDFYKGDFKLIFVNGTEVNTKDYNGHFLTLDPKILREGRNQIIAVFRHEYSNNGAGLYKFVDSEDKNIYLYSHFEPYDASMMFPCFDQPDLKAQYKLKVRAPKEWSVISTTIESEKIAEGNATVWVFPNTQKIATYAFSLHAGPYAQWSDTAKGQAGAIPLRLFARKAMAKYVRPAEWFANAKYGFIFFEKYFSYAYPYKKYDQIIVPNFNYGAMENVAAVTFSERYVVRGKVTIDDEEKLANTLLHELAHMWFGNLVTMKWWNDLWLNESFATIMAYKAVSAMPKFKNAWQSFHGTKRWAYNTDDQVTTHPIETEVTSTEEAFTNFDGITYGKGASVLKQLSFMLGEDAFKKGLAYYFKTYANSNTERKDFINALAKAADKDLNSWTNEWLQTAGANRIEAKFTCEKEKISSFSIEQTAPSDHPTLRSHRLTVATFTPSGEKLKLEKQQTLTISGPSTNVRELIGTKCPAVVFPNYGDQAFVHVNFDQKSLSELPKQISKIDDELTRTVSWGVLWQMVRDQKLSLQDYAQMAAENVGREKNYKIFQTIINSLSRGWDAVNGYLPSKPDTSDRKAQVEALIEGTVWRELEKAKSGSDEQKFLVNAYLDCATSQTAQERLSNWLANKRVPSGLTFDQDLRWRSITRLTQLGNAHADSLAQAESKRDPSDWGKKAMLGIAASKPTAENKRQQFNKVVNADSSMALGDLKSVMGNSFGPLQRHLRESIADEYFTALPKVAKERDSYFIESFTGAFAPLDCTTSLRQRTQSFLDSKRSQLPYQVTKALRIGIQEDERCEKIQSLFLQSTPIEPKSR